MILVWPWLSPWRKYMLSLHTCLPRCSQDPACLVSLLVPPKRPMAFWFYVSLRSESMALCSSSPLFSQSLLDAGTLCSKSSRSTQGRHLHLFTSHDTTALNMQRRVRTATLHYSITQCGPKVFFSPCVRSKCFCHPPCADVSCWFVRLPHQD